MGLAQENQAYIPIHSYRSLYCTVLCLWFIEFAPKAEETGFVLDKLVSLILSYHLYFGEGKNKSKNR